jgi:hemolysin activation/secretion protein
MRSTDIRRASSMFKLRIIKFSNHFMNMQYIINPKATYSSYIIYYAFGVGLSILGYVSSANAQDAGALQRQLQQQLESGKIQSQERIEKPIEKKEIDPNEQKLTLQGFKFKGNTLITDEQLNALVKPWLVNQITFNELKVITSEIQNFYQKNHRIALVSTPPQEIVDGIVLIEIVEGKLGALVVEPLEGDQKLRISIERAKLYFSNSSDGSQYINTEPLERGLVLLNDLPGVKATGEFGLGKNPGESNYYVKLSDEPLFNGQAALSNYGSASTGVGQAIVNLSINNPSGIGDQVTIDAISSTGSTYGQMSYSLPVGYSGWRVGAQTSYLTYQTLQDWSSTRSSGTAKNLGLNLAYPLQREGGNNSNVRFAVESKGYSNEQLSSNISDYESSLISAGINGNIIDSISSIIRYSATVSVGNLVINNASQAMQDASGATTAGSYQKINFMLSRYTELSILPKTAWLINATGQLANKNLNSSEQIYMGGAYGVRAYPVSQGGASQGFILNNELQHQIDTNWQIGVFADLGFVQQYVNPYSNFQGLTNANNNYQLAAYGLTLGYTVGKFNVNSILGVRFGDNPLYNSSGNQLNADSAYRKVQGWIRASYSF